MNKSAYNQIYLVINNKLGLVYNEVCIGFRITKLWKNIPLLIIGDK